MYRVVVIACVIVLALSAEWKRADFQGDLVLGVGTIKSSPQTAYVAAGANGVGAEVLMTTNSGVNWTRATLSTPGLMFLDAAVSKDDASNVMVAGALRSEYSVDGETFQPSRLLSLGASQSVESISEGVFGMTGVYGSSSGVAVSEDKGKTFTIRKIDTLDAMYFPARYGAFPSEKTWYVTAGTWPMDDDQEGQALSQRHHIGPHRTLDLQDNITDYYAAIVKTTDGGQTWTTLFNSTGECYMNGIDCFDEMHCLAVAEGPEGAHAFSTSDGTTFKRVDVDATGPKASLMAARMVSQTEGWLAGGYLDAINMEARFWHTTDGGDSYEKNALKGIDILGMDCADAEHCYAVGLNRVKQGVIALYN